MCGLLGSVETLLEPLKQRVTGDVKAARELRTVRTAVFENILA